MTTAAANATVKPEYNKCLEKAWIIGVLNDTVIDVRARLPNGGNVEREREIERAWGLKREREEMTAAACIRY